VPEPVFPGCDLSDSGDPAGVGLMVANGQMNFAGFETRSKIWVAERRDTMR
jgi:hypothetical protein